ncbi:fungal-specific transcription factor domain-containing protein [Hyaloraphidium curvatum]|nr:fungal-specific transcription factor domain-containing protein [Hyaloraphidium curvatum]
MPAGSYSRAAAGPPSPLSELPPARRDAYAPLDFDFGGAAEAPEAATALFPAAFPDDGELGVTFEMTAPSPDGLAYPDFDLYGLGPPALVAPGLAASAAPDGPFLAFDGRTLGVAGPFVRTPSSSTMGSDRPVRKRVANACDQCFQRKAACDGQAPCARCIKLELDCARTRIRKKPGPAVGSVSARKRKTKASPESGSGTEFERSPSFVLDSQFSLGRQPSDVSIGLSPYGMSSALMLPSDEAAGDMIKSFFRKTYYMSFPFLHKPTFLSTFRQQPPYLQFAIFANAARFASQRDISDRPRTAALHFYEHAKATLEPTMLRLPSLLPQETVAVVQTLLLLMNYCGWVGSKTLGQRFINLAVMVARQSGMNREVRDLLKDARRQASKRQAGQAPFAPGGSEGFGDLRLAVDGAGTDEAEELERLHEPRDQVAALSSMTPLDEEIRRRTWFVTFYCACAWSLSTKDPPLVAVSESQVNLPLTERDFNLLNQQSVAIAARSGDGLALDSPGPEEQSCLTLPSRISMGWPDFEPGARVLVLQSTVATTEALAAQGNFGLMAHAFGIAARVLAVKQKLQQHETAGPFCPYFPPSLAAEWLAAERAADEFWAALPPELVSGAAWDSLASDDTEYSEVVPGVLLVFLMSRMSLNSPDRLPMNGAPMEPRDEETRRRWVASAQFLRCVEDARTMAQILKKLYIRNPEAIDYMKGLVLIGVYGSGLTLLELVRNLSQGEVPGVEELVAGAREDVGYHVRSLRGVQHTIPLAGKLADHLDGELAACG